MATITFDQAGLSPAGIANRSRSDGLIDGSEVTITLDQPGFVSFVDVPEGDVDSVSSLEQSGPTVWKFTPTAGIYGSWLVEAQPFAPNTKPVRRVFAIRSPGKGLRIPAFNERASNQATVANGASHVDESDDNEGESYRGWARALAEVYRELDPPTRFVDSVNGDDANDGASITTPYKTLARVKQDLTIKDMRVLLARGSRFREELSGWPVGARVGAYGSGRRPIVDGRDIASNASFSKTAGQTNVYQISWTHFFGADGGKSHHKVWEADKQMTRAATLAACDSTPGSFFANAPTTGGPDLIYVHPTGNTAPTLQYAITKRQYAVQLYNAYNQAHVTSLEMIGNSHSDGSLCIDGYAEDCVARDGRIHNAFILGTAVNCHAIGIETGQNATLFVSYYDNGPTFGGPHTRDIIYRGCTAQGNNGSDPVTGFYVHTNNDGRDFGAIQYEDCRVVDAGGGWGVSGAAKLVCYRCTFANVYNVYQIGATSNLILGGGGVLNNGTNSRLFIYPGAAGITHVLHGVKCHKLGGGEGPIVISAPADVTVRRCTLTCPSSGGYNRLFGGDITWDHNVVTGAANFTQLWIEHPNTLTKLNSFDGDYNAYWTSFYNGFHGVRMFGGSVELVGVASFHTYLLANYGPGTEANSLDQDAQVTDPANGDFTIQNATVRALGAGAEPDEENDPELQALWAQYRIPEFSTVNIDAHAARHQDGGADEINVAGLKGRLADPQTAGGIRTATTVVSVAASTAPTAGQALIATSSTVAGWTTPLQLTVAGTPTQISVTTAAVGSGTVAARNDHLHSVSTAAPVALTVGGANAPGSATTLVRSDHTHALPTFGTTGGTFCEGNDARLLAAAGGGGGAPLIVPFAPSLNLDVSAKHDFAINALTGNVTFIFDNATPGSSGLIWVKQDGTGGRTVTFTSPAGYTAVKDLGFVDLQPQSAANAVTLYTYAMVALSGTNYMQIGKSFLG